MQCVIDGGSCRRLAFSAADALHLICWNFIAFNWLAPTLGEFDRTCDLSSSLAAVTRFDHLASVSQSNQVPSSECLPLLVSQGFIRFLSSWFFNVFRKRLGQTGWAVVATCSCRRRYLPPSDATTETPLPPRNESSKANREELSRGHFQTPWLDSCGNSLEFLVCALVSVAKRLSSTLKWLIRAFLRSSRSIFVSPTQD